MIDTFCFDFLSVINNITVFDILVWFLVLLTNGWVKLLRSILSKGIYYISRHILGLFDHNFPAFERSIKVHWIISFLNVKYNPFINIRWRNYKLYFRIFVISTLYSALNNCMVNTVNKLPFLSTLRLKSSITGLDTKLSDWNENKITNILGKKSTK